MLNRDSTSTVFVSLLGLVSIGQKKDTLHGLDDHLQTDNTFTNI